MKFTENHLTQAFCYISKAMVTAGTIETSQTQWMIVCTTYPHLNKLSQLKHVKFGTMFLKL